jgi:hypothetical protein
LKPPPPPPPTTSASSIDVTPTGIVKVCPVLKVIMHLPETETSTVTALEFVFASPEVQATHLTDAIAGKLWHIRKKLKRAIRDFFIRQV